MTDPVDACKRKRAFNTAALAATAAEMLNATSTGPGRVWYRCPACTYWHFCSPRNARHRKTVANHRRAAQRRNRQLKEAA